MLPNRQPRETQTLEILTKLLVTALAGLMWMAVVANLSMSPAGSITIAALVIGITITVAIGKYHPGAPRFLSAFSKLWLKRWKYTVTLLALTAASVPVGRAMQHDKQNFDAMNSAKQKAEQEAQERQATAQRSREAEETKRFKKMSPAEHLEAATKALTFAYDPKERIGGDLEEAERHLGEIGADAPEHKRRDQLQKEIASRRERLAKVWYRETQKKIAEDRKKIAEDRKKFADDLDSYFIKQGINVDGVQAVGKDHTILRINYALCSRVFFDRITPSEAIAAWRAMGFTRVECRAYDESISQDLE